MRTLALMMLFSGAASTACRSSPPSDASVDVIAPDSVIPDGLDSTADAASSDAARLSPYPWLDATHCDLRTVDNPRDAVAALHWQACPDGRIACSELSLNWAPPTLPRRLWNTVFGSTSGPTPWLAIARSLSASTVEWVVSPADGPIASAWRSSLPEGCDLVPISFSGGNLGVMFVGDLGPTTLGEWLMLGPLPDGSRWSESVIELPQTFLAGQAGVQDLVVSDRTAALTLAPGNFVLRAADGGVSLVARSNDTNGILGAPSLVGSEVVAAGYGLALPDGGVTGVVRRFGEDGDAGTLVTSAAGDVVSAYAAEGVLAWVVGIGYQQPYTYDRYELWASDYATSGSPVAPRFVGPVPNNGATGVLSPPYFALLHTDDPPGFTGPPTNYVVVISLADGSRWTIHPRTDSIFTRIVFVTNDEIALGERLNWNAPPGEIRTISRFRFAGLGDRSPPPAPH